MNALSWLHGKLRLPNSAKLVFLNETRVYCETKHCVTFWGFDKAFEITFDIPEDELKRLCPHKSEDEASVLQAFDRSRSAVERMATAAHLKSSQRHHRLSS